MSNSHILRIAKLIGDGKILKAAKHNKREIQAELGSNGNIDATRSILNYSLAGAENARGIADRAKYLIADAGYQKLRKDAVVGIEIIFSLPPARHNFDNNPFFTDCLHWTKKHFGGVVLSYDVHLDEAMPHAHALILPLLNNRMQGSDMVGNKSRLIALQDSFYEHVGRLYGFEKANRKLSGNQKMRIEQDVLNYLRSDSVMSSVVWPRVRDDIQNNPEVYRTLLGIRSAPLKIQKEKDFVSIMISTGKGKRENSIDV